jgi:hypothetical protein
MQKTLAVNNKTLRPHVCEYCARSFKEELSLINHSCEKKRRWFSKDDPPVRIAFMAWTRFYELNAHLTKASAKRTFKDFMDSPYYIAFVKFGRHLIALNVIDSAKFIDYVIKNNLPLDNWTHDKVYEQYVQDLLKTESPETALERNIQLMQTWGEEFNEPWNDFFKKVAPSQAAAWVASGRLSPWVMYNADSAEQLLDRCGPEQLAMITKFAKPAQWKIRFNKNKDGADWIRTTLRSAGL